MGSSDSLSFEELHTTNSVDLMEDSQEQCTSDLISNNESLTNLNEMLNSPIFLRSDSNSKSNSFNKNVFSMISTNESTSPVNNLSIDNGQNISNETSCAFANSPTSNVSSVLLCSTPIRNKKVPIRKKRNVKKNGQSKTPLNNLRKRNNLSIIRREKALKKTPLKIINNMNLIPNNNSQINQNNNLDTIRYNIEVTETPRSKKFKQTKLVFHKTVESMESSYNRRSNNTPVLTKSNKSPRNQEKVLRQSTLTDMIGSKKKENSLHFNNIYNQSERCNDTVKSTEIKNELMCHQECEPINSMETNDPLNISNKSDSTFFPEFENNISLNKSLDTSFNFERSSSSSEKLTNEPDESTDQLTKKKKIIHLLRAKENVINIIDIDEPTEKSIESSTNGSYKKSKRHREEECWHYNSNNPIKKEATPMDFCTVMLPDNYSNTT
ncbi:beclin-1-like protein A isoform X1 [Polistes fuscatus]|uniref:beclin-1-like protein A isoform X1 n=1 Tax=Polistes fuscatus TaxID=30207 RepID=UPI001CA893B9|nr:beclin-1-like protein A isoform X1 [Polistes fuscatus]